MIALLNGSKMRCLNLPDAYICVSGTLNSLTDFGNLMVCELINALDLVMFDTVEASMESVFDSVSLIFLRFLNK